MAKPDPEVSNHFDRSLHTFTFESLFYKAKKHLTTKVTKCRRSVGVDRQKVWSNDCLILGNFCYKTSGMEKLSTENNNKSHCALLKLSTRDKQGVADWKGAVGTQRVTIRVIFVWPWKMVSVSVCYLFYQPMDEKNKTWILRFPTEEKPNMEKALFDWPLVLQYDVKAKYRLISRRFFGHEVFSAERSLNQPKARCVCIRSINQSNRCISVRLLFLFCSRVFISRSYENCSNIILEVILLSR